MEQQEVPHYLIDICEPTETLTVAEYQQHARELIEGSRESGVGSRESGIEEDAGTRGRGDAEKQLTINNQPLITDSTQNS
jgi:tRNA dimethylallyltransferase